MCQIEKFGASPFRYVRTDIEVHGEERVLTVHNRVAIPIITKRFAFLELFFLLQSMALNAIHALLSDLQGESNPPVGIACQTQRSAVELHDLPRKAQPDARAVGLGRVEGGKDIFGDLGRDRSPVVVELDDNSLRRG